MTHTHAKVKVKGYSVKKLQWKRTDAGTEAITLPILLTRLVGLII